MSVIVVSLCSKLVLKTLAFSCTDLLIGYGVAQSETALRLLVNCNQHQAPIQVESILVARFAIRKLRRVWSLHTYCNLKFFEHSTSNATRNLTLTFTVS